MGSYVEVQFGGINISYTHDLDGGGSRFGQEYIAAIKARYPDRKFARCFEWCSGPGFIGYSLLGHGLCESLCLADIHRPAVEAARRTAEKNDLEGKVGIYESDGLSNLPDHENFDLVVGNPPWYHHPVYKLKMVDPRLYVDPGWRVHRDFFAGISKHLAPQGLILLQECQWASDISSFQQMIEDNGLKVSEHFLSRMDAGIYYIEIQHK